jgi:hypothetical protein
LIKLRRVGRSKNRADDLPAIGGGPHHIAGEAPLEAVKVDDLVEGPKLGELRWKGHECILAKGSSWRDKARDELRLGMR